jgi:hypothetical protein
LLVTGSSLHNFKLQGVVYPDSIHAIDYSIDAPLLDEAGVTTGGYAMVRSSSSSSSALRM